jgi:hypothetical protein
VGKLRGKVHTYQGVPLVVTYHPAYLLRNLPDKARAWDDLCLAAADRVCRTNRRPEREPMTPPPSLQATDRAPLHRLDVPTLLAHRADPARPPVHRLGAVRRRPARPGPTHASTTPWAASPAAWRGAACVAGERVLIHLDNGPEALLAWYACGWIGAVAVTTNARAADDELAYYADHCGAVCAITQPKLCRARGGALPRASAGWW